MPRLQLANTTEHLALLAQTDSPRTLARCLVGHTVEEVERELIVCTLYHYCGNRTCAAKVLGVSVRTLRNKINNYTAQGISVPAPGQNQSSTSTDTTESAMFLPATRSW
jgi:two-component system, response regulator FlrC